ncbi:hypothetical protein BDV19DRAFT_366517 [Aspergillus venezuelensis]
MGLLSALSAPFYILVVYPVYYVAFGAYFILSLVASPFIHIGSWALWLTLLPVRIVIGLKALLIYLGVASFSGAGIALLLYFITTLVIDLVLSRFSRSPTVARLKPRPRRRAIEAPKQPRLDQIDSGDDPWTDWAWGVDAAPLKKRGLASETILEEESQDSEPY